jgi:hypothetical protein
MQVMVAMELMQVVATQVVAVVGAVPAGLHFLILPHSMAQVAVVELGCWGKELAVQLDLLDKWAGLAVLAVLMALQAEQAQAQIILLAQAVHMVVEAVAPHITVLVNLAALVDQVQFKLPTIQHFQL